MTSFREFLYGIHNDLKRNRWINDKRNSDYYGLVMMFHNVSDDFNSGAKDCNCTISDFCRIIEQYQAKGFTFLPVDKALEIVNNKTKEKFVVVTFDDIPDNVYKNAYPVLRDLNIPFTIFITAGFIGKEGFVTREQLYELNNDPLCTIGAHTMTHPMLRHVENSKWEIEQCKKELELLTGKEISYFAYPYGRYSTVSSKVKREVIDAGYECAFSSISAPLTEVSSEDLFFLPRIVASPGEIINFTKSWTFVNVLIRFFIRPLRNLCNLTYCKKS